MSFGVLQNFIVFLGEFMFLHWKKFKKKKKATGSHIVYIAAVSLRRMNGLEGSL